MYTDVHIYPIYIVAAVLIAENPSWLILGSAEAILANKTRVPDFPSGHTINQYFTSFTQVAKTWNEHEKETRKKL